MTDRSRQLPPSSGRQQPSRQRGAYPRHPGPFAGSRLARSAVRVLLAAIIGGLCAYLTRGCFVPARQTGSARWINAQPAPATTNAGDDGCPVASRAHPETVLQPTAFAKEESPMNSHDQRPYYPRDDEQRATYDRYAEPPPAAYSQTPQRLPLLDGRVLVRVVMGSIVAAATIHLLHACF